MLSNEEKEKILLEERYRKEIKDTLEKEPGKRKFNLLNFFNSNFGSFLLSTVIVGGISFLYDSHQEQIKKIEKQQMEYRINEQWRSKLFTEFSHRMNTLRSLADTLKEYQSKDIYLAYHGSIIGNDSKIQATYYNFRSYYPEFSEYSVVKVLDELTRYDTVTNYTQLISALINVGPDIVNLGQSWFYQINSKINLPYGIAIKSNEIQKVYYYTINGDIKTLNAGDSFIKLWYVGKLDGVKNLMSSMNERINAAGK